jgi:hypothetical protein
MDCRHFIDCDDSTYMEERGIILKRWPRKVMDHTPEYEGECYCDGCYFGNGPCFHRRVK